MDRNLRIFIVRIMIIISIFFVGIGFYYDTTNNKKSVVVSNSNNVDDTSNSKNNISITTTDSLSTDGENINSYQETSNNTHNNISTNTLNIEQVNDNLRKTIQNRYGVIVKYGSETDNYIVGGLETTSLTDTSVINKTLSSLNYNMSLYPNGFFKEFNNSGLMLIIYLIKNYSTANVTGVTDSTTNNVVMSIATDYSFNESFNHETYHYIEDFINVNGGSYTTWNNLNPNNFVYGTMDKSLTYSNTKSSDSYFVNSYAEVSEFEDRASTFEYMTSSYKASCLTNGKTIYLKAQYMANQIDLFFETVSPSVTEYWERYLVE